MSHLASAPPSLALIPQRFDVCVVGLGARGAQLAALATERGLSVAGFDPCADAVARFNRGEVHGAGQVAVAIEDGLAAGLLRAFDGAVRAEVYIVRAGATVQADGTLDEQVLERALSAVAGVVDPGGLIVLDGPMPIHTARGQLGAQLGARSLRIGPDVSVAVATSSEHASWLVGGVTARCTQRAASFLSDLLETSVVPTRAEVCEVVGLAAGAYWHLHAAFVNELAGVCQHLGLDGTEAAAALELATGTFGPDAGLTSERGQAAPRLFEQACPHETALCRLSIRRNTEEAARIVARVRGVARRFRDPTIACLGLIHPEDPDDVQSPAASVAETIVREQLGSVVVVEPRLQKSPIEGAPLEGLEAALRKADIVVVLTPTEAFGHAPVELYARASVIDTVGLLCTSPPLTGSTHTDETWSSRLGGNDQAPER